MQTACGRVLVYIVLGGVIAVGFVCFIAGVVLVVTAKTTILKTVAPTSQSGYSDEANRIGLENFLLKIRNRYFELYPNRIASKPGVTSDEVKRKFKPFNPKPHIIKKTTDAAKELMKELDSLKVSMNKLTMFEQRAIDQAKYWVSFVLPYGVPYQYNYYTGDWMLGPDIFCWTPTCFSLWELIQALKHLKPVTTEDLGLIKNLLQESGQGFLTDVDNMKLGVAAGMVRNVEACKSGLETMQTMFRMVMVEGVKGILNGSLGKEIVNDKFLSDLKPDQVSEWKSKHGKSPKESLAMFVVDFIGKPAQQWLRYLEFNHSRHCVSSDISSGFGSLPLKNVYVDSKPVSQSTGRLPSGETIMDGKEIYKIYLAYFTTTTVTPDEIYDIGKDLVDKLYPELLKQAREITGKSDNEKAKKQMLIKLNNPDNFFNDEPIPAGESNKDAHAKCINMETAKVHCPVRWSAMNKVFSYVKEMLTFLTYKSLDLFHFVGRMISVPSCPVEPVANFNPAAPAAAYYESDPNCSFTAKYYIPFFLEKMGPKSEEWSISAHEMIPGHHLQVQGYFEYFLPESSILRWMCRSIYFLTFAEGWAQYAEGDLIAHETDAYKTIPFLKFSGLRWQVLRGVRLMIETSIHTRGMKRKEAIKMLTNYTWGGKDRVAREITRFQSVPGQGVTYTYGRRTIMKIREKAKKALGKKFNIKDFHYQLLRYGGTATMRYLEKAMEKYTSCELDKKQDGCKDVLDPPVRPQYSGGSSNFYAQDWSQFRVD